MLGPDRCLSRHSNMTNRIRLIGIKVYEEDSPKAGPFLFLFYKFCFRDFIMYTVLIIFSGKWLKNSLIFFIKK